MPLLRLTNGFDELSDSNLVARAREIRTAITNNPAFINPRPSMEVFSAAIEAFDESLAIATNGGSLDKAVKNEKKRALVDRLHSLGYYVLYIADGDETVARSSGFGIAKRKSPRPAPTKPLTLQLSDGPNAGELKLRFKRPEGTVSFIYGITEHPQTSESVWAQHTGTRCKAMFTRLASGKRYLCRVTVVGVNGQQVASDTVTRVVQ